MTYPESVEAQVVAIEEAAEDAKAAYVEAKDKTLDFREMTGIEKLSYVQTHVHAPKDQQARGQKVNFKYRNLGGINKAAKPYLWEVCASIVYSDELVVVNDFVFVKATATFICEGFTQSATHYTMNNIGKTGMNPAQISGAVSTYARKKAVEGLLALDESEDDVDELSAALEAWRRDNEQAVEEQRKGPAPKAQTPRPQQSQPVQQVITPPTNETPEQRVERYRAKVAHAGADPEYFGARCTNCGKEFQPINSVERMAAAKCNSCGNTEFDVHGI